VSSFYGSGCFTPEILPVTPDALNPSAAIFFFGPRVVRAFLLFPTPANLKPGKGV
jgi:hypothetical protein